MKCPKCGFVSFEYLTECKGCSLELVSHKDEYEIDMDEPQMLPILAYYNQQNESKKNQVEDEINQLHDEQEAVVVGEELSDLDAQPLEEETVSLGDLTEEANEVDLSGTEVPNLDDIELYEKVEDIDLDALSEDKETVELEFGAKPEEKTEEISLDLGEELAPAPEKEEVLSLDDITGDKAEEISLDLGLDLEDEPKEEVEELSLDDVILEEPEAAPATEDVGEEISLAEVEASATQQEEVESIDLNDIEEVEDISLSLSLDDEEPEPLKAETTPHRGGEEEVVTLDNLLDDSGDEGDELSFGVEEFDLTKFETETPEKAETKTPEAAPAQFETGGLELSLEGDDDAAQRAAELKKKEQEQKSFDDLDIDLKLEIE